MVVDQNGVEIVAGQSVIVHQDDGDHDATVLEPFEDCPTVNERGHWVDIDKGEGVEGMMSYILEVLPQLTDKESAALDLIPADAVSHWCRGEKWDFGKKTWCLTRPPE